MTALVTTLALTSFFPVGRVLASQQPNIEAKSYVLMDAESGAVLIGKEEDTPLPPASMTKMMTEYLVLEAIRDGKISWDQQMTISTNASLISGSEVWLKENEVRTVEELFTAMSVYSANDATVALAELIAGDETSFVHKMNEKAKKMGLKQTHFINSTGLPQDMYPDPPQVEGEHVMSAKDSATLGRHLIRDFPEITKFSTIAKQTFRKGEPGAINMVNWNWMIKGLPHAYEGVDGLKTGETEEAGACFTGTAKRGDFRLIAVVMGTESRTKRFQETKKLFDYGFAQYEPKTFVKKNAPIKGRETVEVAGGKETALKVVAADNLKLAVKKDDVKKYKLKATFDKELKAPIKAGATVGKVTLTYDGKPISNLQSLPLVAAHDVEQAGWFRLFFRNVKHVITGFFS